MHKYTHLHTQEENFDEAAKAAFHAWTPYTIREWLFPLLSYWLFKRS